MPYTVRTAARLLMFGWLMVVAGTACAKNVTTGDASSLPIPSQTANVAVPQAVRFFPTQTPSNGEREVLEALFEGQLVIENGCVRAVDQETNTNYVVIWPPRTSARTDTNGTQLLSDTGQTLNFIGTPFRMGGGEIPADSATTLFEQSSQVPPDDCDGPYWLAGDIPVQ